MRWLIFPMPLTRMLDIVASALRTRLVLAAGLRYCGGVYCWPRFVFRKIYGPELVVLSVQLFGHKKSGK